jgi:hypothetical protein
LRDGVITQPPAADLVLARAPARHRIPDHVWLLGLVVIGWQKALSYAEGDWHARFVLLTCGNDLLRPGLGGDRVLKKVITWAVVVFVVYYLATDPHGAANFIHHVYNGLKSAGHSMTKFVNSL